MWELAAEGLWTFRFDKLGRYWGPICGEVDILGLDTISSNMVIGECKYTDSEKGLSILHVLQDKAAALESKTGYKCRSFAIFSTGGFTKGLIEDASRNPSVVLIDTFTPLLS